MKSLKNLNKVFFSIFLITITSCSEVNKSSNISKLEVNTKQDIGLVKFGDTLTKQISFKNTSSNDLIIKRAESSCGCTSVKLKDSIIKPNSNGEIRVSLTPKVENNGVINESIIIEANTKPIFTVIYLKGKVVN